MTDDPEFSEKPKSKTQVKREMHVLQEFGRELTRLPDAVLVKLDLDDELLEEIRLGRTLKQSAHKRQIKHLGGMLRERDAGAIRDRLATIQRPKKEEVQAFHEVEDWRDRLVSGDDSVFDELRNRFPGLDRQHVRQLIRNARSEQEKGGPPRASRQLFRYISELSEN